MKHFIYKITCLITKRYYIGMHSTKNVDDEYFGSGKFLKNSIAKYGIENHSKQILEFCDSRIELAQREKEIVTSELLLDKLCMNLKVGGEGGWDHISSEKKKLGAIQMNVKTWNDPEFVKRKKKFASERMINLHKKGQINYATRTGHIHSEQEKENRKKTFEKINHQQGEKNSMYGKMWIYNQITFESIRIEKDSLIPEGWIKGRKMKASSK